MQIQRVMKVVVDVDKAKTADKLQMQIEQIMKDVDSVKDLSTSLTNKLYKILTE